AGRPLSMQRFPDGIGEKGFYQKEAPGYFPAWIRRASIRVEGTGENQPQVICDEAATLVYLANQNCITPHLWLSRLGGRAGPEPLDHPDRLIFDLDPPAGAFELARAAAASLRALLEELGLAAFLMTTGSRGLHVAAPLDGRADFDAARAFAHQVAQRLARRKPDKLTTETRKAERNGRLFLDYLRNAYAATSVAPYAVRARPGAPVATPLDWGELDDGRLRSDRYTLKNIFRRLGQKGDPWQGITAAPGSLAAARRRLAELDA
ncbi:MAG: DNA polymerase domain-containing protein, partial [Candidatus Promineifilaceae bacterium]